MFANCAQARNAEKWGDRRRQGANSAARWVSTPLVGRSANALSGPTKGLISGQWKSGWSRIAGVGAKRVVGRQAETSQRAVRRGLEFLGRYGVSPLEWEAGEFSAPAWGKSFPQSESEEVD